MKLGSNSNKRNNYKKFILYNYIYILKIIKLN